MADSSTSTMPPSNLHTSNDLLICTACGAQYDVVVSTTKSSCRICDDPRQFVPPSGQCFTTLTKLRQEGHRNKLEACVFNPHIYEISTEPKFGIGQRACLIKLESGKNVLWDLVALLDQETVKRIEELGGLECIIISHPHFYTTWHDWAATFNCPVYMSAVDSVWANRTNSPFSSPSSCLKLLTEQQTTILPGVTAVICGGHFDGSLILHESRSKSLFVADTILAVPSAFNPDPAKEGVTSYAFMWSIPNAIPLGPDKILKIWRAIKGFDFEATFGVFAGASNVQQKPGQRMSLKERVLESGKIAVRHMGYEQHSMLDESL